MASEQILVLEQGRIVESGTHQDLLVAGGRYSELWRNQQEREGEKEGEKEKEIVIREVIREGEND